MDLHQYRTSKLRRWIGFALWSLIFARVAFLLGAKLYLGASFKSADFILAVFGLLGGVVAYLYLKVLLWPKERGQNA